MTIALLYHDVIENGEYSASGFEGASALPYKLSSDEFRAHIRGIADAFEAPARTVLDLQPGPMSRIRIPQFSRNTELMVTFDDGGASAYPFVHDLVSELGWRCHFFITTSRIDTKAFLNKDQIRALNEAGHVVGSHSHLHPPRISLLSYPEILDEWRKSVEILEDLTGRPTTVASVPGGFLSNNVIRAAGEAGIQYLFTSEPTSYYYRAYGCTVIGRYSVQQGISKETVVGFAKGQLTPRFRQWAYWNTKKTLKRFAGPLYAKTRGMILKKRYKDSP